MNHTEEKIISYPYWHKTMQASLLRIAGTYSAAAATISKAL